MLQCNEYLITANNIEQFKTPFTWGPDKVLNGQELADPRETPENLNLKVSNIRKQTNGRLMTLNA